MFDYCLYVYSIKVFNFICKKHTNSFVEIIDLIIYYQMFVLLVKYYFILGFTGSRSNAICKLPYQSTR